MKQYIKIINVVVIIFALLMVVMFMVIRKLEAMKSVLPINDINKTKEIYRMVEIGQNIKEKGIIIFVVFAILCFAYILLRLIYKIRSK